MRRLIIIALAVLFLAGYRNSYGQNTADPVLTTIEVNLGENVVIALDSNHTTGFSWQLAKPLDNNLLEFSETRYETGGTRLIGAGGKEIWVFKTLQKGKTEIELKYTQPWEKNKPPARQASFVVIIK